jgi:hypothetical protein
VWHVRNVDGRLCYAKPFTSDYDNDTELDVNETSYGDFGHPSAADAVHRLRIVAEECNHVADVEFILTEFFSAVRR